MKTAANLKNTGLKITGPRIKILELFYESNQRHLSAEEVYRILVQDGKDVGLATIYRVLTQFEQSGILTRNQFEGGRACYELNDGLHHDHLLCLDCGRVEEFFDPDLEHCQDRVAEELGFRIADHALSIYAHCNKKDCQHQLTEKHKPTAD